MGSKPDKEVLGLERFWVFSSNKRSFQVFYPVITFFGHTGSNTVHLEVAHKEDELLRLQISDKFLIKLLLWCSHEEADNRVLFHLRLEKSLVHQLCHQILDILVNSIYQFSQRILL